MQLFRDIHARGAIDEHRPEATRGYVVQNRIQDGTPPMAAAAGARHSGGGGIGRRLVEAVLTDQGHKIVLATDSWEALDVALAPEPAFDVPLTALQLPSLGGEALVRWLLSRRPDLFVVVMTGHLTPEADRALGAEGEPMAVLQTPVLLEQLAAEIARVTA